MKFKIGIFGSAAGELTPDAINRAKELGKSLAEKNVAIITGACPGLPYIAVAEAAKDGAEVIGYSSVTTLELQKKYAANNDHAVYTKFIFIPEDFPFANDSRVSMKYRNVISTANCDAGIIISGRWGTLNEFTNLFDFGKVIGVLTGTGGIANELPALNKKINKPSKAKVFFSKDPKKLVKLILAELHKRHSGNPAVAGASRISSEEILDKPG